MAERGRYCAEPLLRHGLLAACILVFRQRKAKDRKNKVLILDASKEFKTDRAQNELLPAHAERIHGWYRDFKDVEGVARVVTLEEIAANDYNLNIPRYVEPKIEQETLTVEEAMQRLQASAEAAFAAEDRLVGHPETRESAAMKDAQKPDHVSLNTLWCARIRLTGVIPSATSCTRRVG